jgi:hypothetical protein
MINVTATVSLLELTWVIIGLIGLTAHFTLFFRSIEDKRIAIRHNSARRIHLMSDACIRRQFVYALAQLGMILLGLNAMTIPPNDDAPTVAVIVSGMTIIFVELFLITNALWDQYDNHRLLTEIGGRRITDES